MDIRGKLSQMRALSQVNFRNCPPPHVDIILLLPKPAILLENRLQELLKVLTDLIYHHKDVLRVDSL